MLFSDMVESIEIQGPDQVDNVPTDSSVVVRRASLADLWGLAWLRTLAGWNQDAGFWRMLLMARTAEVWALSLGRRILGVSSIWAYGTELAWIGMVIVHPAYRRRGFGKELLQHCLRRCEQMEVAVVGLDATPAGEELYKSLGFVPGEVISRMILPASEARSPKFSVGGLSCGKLKSGLVMRDWGTLDATAFGADRSGVLEGVASETITCDGFSDHAGRCLGYGMLRRGARQLYLGPVVASRPEVGRELVLSVLRQSEQKSVIWDVPQKNFSAMSLSRELGFEFSRKLTRMWLPRELPVGRPEWSWAIADPALG